MAELTPQAVDDVRTTSTAGAAEAAEALGRAFDTPLALKPGSPASFAGDTIKDLTGPGLILALKVGASGALLVLPATSGAIPGWCANPDLTGQSKLSTLAQELGIILLPEVFMPEDCGAGWAPNLKAALAQAEVSDEAVVLPLELSSDEKPCGTLSLIWPAKSPMKALECPAPASQPTATAPPTSKAAPPAPSRPTPAALPPYTRSLLRIKVPVVVTLAEKRQALSKIVELGTGSIIQFDKSCEEMLQLSVGNRPIACGEAVKVGDKFGLRITSMTPPEENFQPLRPAKRGRG